jgi:hypothetical protein
MEDRLPFTQGVAPVWRRWWVVVDTVARIEGTLTNWERSRLKEFESKCTYTFQKILLKLAVIQRRNGVAHPTCLPSTNFLTVLWYLDNGGDINARIYGESVMNLFTKQGDISVSVYELMLRRGCDSFSFYERLLTQGCATRDIFYACELLRYYESTCRGLMLLMRRFDVNLIQHLKSFIR